VNDAISPDGTQNADRLVEAAAGSNACPGVRQQINCAPSTTYTLSFYAKYGSRRYICPVVYDGFVEIGQNFDLQAGVKGTHSQGGVVSSSMIAVGNGWYRCVMTFTTNASTTFSILDLRYNDSDTHPGGVYVQNGSYNWMWGIQLEAGSFPTRYIPTTTAAATRSADVCSISGADFTGMYRQDEGTWVVDSTVPDDRNVTMSLLGPVPSNDVGVFFFNDSNGFGNNHWRVTNEGLNNYSRVDVYSSGVSQATWFSTHGGWDVAIKAAIAIASNNANCAQNGVLSVDDTSVIMPLNQSALSFKGLAPYSGAGVILIQSFTYYPARVHNLYLQSLTQP
jgi:hypothetical protein